ncbi:hypothetical protein TrRE_jg13164, partial [Triparma retinervis]
KFDTEAEAIAGCPAVDGMEVKQLRTKEERCKYEQFCFAKDLPLTAGSLFDSWDWGCMQPEWGGACAQEHLTNGDQSSCAEIDAFKACVDSSSDDQCNYYGDFEEKFAKEGRFDTEEKCTAGVCDQDPGGWMGLTAEECVETASCSNWNCMGCERDWSKWDAPNSICWIPTATDGSAMTEELCSHANYTGTWKDINLKDDSGTTQACIIEGSDNQGPESCKHTIDNEADCTSEKAGTWTSTEETEETCLATKKCKAGQGWFNGMDSTECDKCDNEWSSTNTWWGNTWNVGKMRSMYKWKERKYESKNDWVSELDTWRVKEVIKEIVNALNEEVEGSFVKCMYSPLIDSMEKIACVCGKNRDDCDLEETFGGGVSLVNTTAYTGAAETAGKQQGTRLEIGTHSVYNTAKVEISSQVFIPPVSEDTGSADYGTADTTSQHARRALKRMYRRLTGGEVDQEEEDNSLNSAGCATVVKNSGGFLVGQMVGDCVTLTISEALVEPSRMCINTKTAIQRAPEYSVAGVGEINPGPATELLSETDYIIKDVGAVEENNGQFCFFVSDSTTVCPIMHAPNPEDAGEDVTEGKCGLVEIIVTEVLMKKECEMGDSESCAWLEANMSMNPCWKDEDCPDGESCEMNYQEGRRKLFGTMQASGVCVF